MKNSLSVLGHVAFRQRLYNYGTKKNTLQNDEGTGYMVQHFDYHTAV